MTITDFKRCFQQLINKYDPNFVVKDLEYIMFLQLGGWVFKDRVQLEKTEVVALRKGFQKLGCWFERIGGELVLRQGLDWDEKFHDWHGDNHRKLISDGRP